METVMWDFIPSDLLIQFATAGNYGLARTGWTRTLQQIRALPEVKR